MIMQYLILLVFSTLLVMSQPVSLEEVPKPQRGDSQNCFNNWQYAGEILNDPTVDKTPDPESCQLFCQTVAECSDFSWADGDYSWEIYALGCWLFSEVKVDLVDEHFY